MSCTEADLPDDDAWIEAEIQRQLDALTPQDDNEDDSEEYQNPDNLSHEAAEDDDEVEEDVDVPDSVMQYLERVQHRSEDVEKELQECDDVLKQATQNQSSTDEDSEFYYESTELKELAFQLGEDPEELRDRVISEVQKDELQDAEDAEREDAQSRLEQEEEEEEVLPGNQDDEEDKESRSKHQKETMVVALISASDKYEQAARAKIRELEGRQSQMDHVRHEDREQELQDQARRDRQLEEARIQRQKELDEEQQKLTQERMVVQATANAKLEKETKEQTELLNKYQAEIEEFSKKMQEEKDQLEQQLKEDRETKDKQDYDAAVTIQATYRSYRTRKPYLKKMRQLREEREERKVQERQMEIAEQRKQAEVKKKKEKAEKKKREEADRKKQEELQRKLEEERKEEESREKERKEMERKEKERQEAERLEAERKEKERIEKEKEQLEKERLEMEKKTQDILAKITAEKGLKSGDLNNSETSTDSKTPTTGDDSIVTSTNNTDQHDNSTSSEPNIGDLGSNKEGTPSETSTVLDSDTPEKSEYAKHLNSKTIQSINHPDSLKNIPSLNPDQSENVNSRTNQHTVIDKNENIRNRTSKHGNVNELTKDTSNAISYLSSQQDACFADKERTLQSQPDIKAAGNSSRGHHDHQSDNSNNHASTQGISDNTVVDNVGVGKSNERTPSIDARAFSSDDFCVAPGTVLEPLPEDTEKLRLQWMEKCTSLSKLLSDSKQRVDHVKQRRQLRRPRSAKKLPDLTENQIIAGSAQKTTLDEVSTVHLEDLPGFNLSTLKKCPRLQCLTVHRCGLTAVEGLENSPDVVAINAQDNGVESVNCRDHSQLSILQLAHNHLSNLQGLEGCPRLRWLEVQHNKLTRIRGVESVSSLTHLYASHNQLINTTGLEALVCLQRLDLSHNHLSTVPGIEKCCLLQRLNLSRNSLTEVPELTNHVLLRELYLDDNSLSSLDVISSAWLPMLTTLSVSQNSLPEIPILKGCRLLKVLDISHNFIADIDCVTPGLEILDRLEHLSVVGNPVTEEQNCRTTILSAVPHLKKLDEDMLPSNNEDGRPELTQFEAMCWSQMQAQDDLQAMQQADIENLIESRPNDTLRLAQLRAKHMEEIYKHAEEHRYMHEYGDMTIIARQPNNKRSTGIMESKDRKEEIAAANNAARRMNAERNSSSRDSDRINEAATRIQANWRGYTVRRDIAQHTAYWLAAEVIQSAWRRYAVRRERVQECSENGNWDTPRVWGQLERVAAIKIQALWRGYSVRKRLKVAKQTIKFDDEEDMFGEIDLTSFEFNEASIEQGWLPAETPVLPSSHPVLPPTGPHKPSPPTGGRPLSRQPRQAWRNADSPLLDPHNKNLLGKPPLPPTSPYQDPRQSIGRLNLSPSPTGHNGGAFDDRSQQGTPFGKPPIPPSPSTVLDTPRSNRSNKTDKLSEEWGFKDTTTAELMMRRAKKLNKGNANRKKKMLDPIQRYQKMVKTKETGTSRVAQVPKKGVQRKEYFKAREEEIENAYQEKKEEEHEKKHRTFDWVHNQVGDFEVSDSRINPYGLSGRQSNSEPNLPRMSPDVVLGGRVQLMASPSMELQSVDGASSVTSYPNRNRSNSYSSPDVQLPPIKTNSAPTSHYKERVAAKQATVKNVNIAWGRTPRSGGNSYR